MKPQITRKEAKPTVELPGDPATPVEIEMQNSYQTSTETVETNENIEEINEEENKVENRENYIEANEETIYNFLDSPAFFNLYIQDEEDNKDYSNILNLETNPSTSSRPYIDQNTYSNHLSTLLTDFEGLENLEVFGPGVYKAEYQEDSEISERLVMDLESMFPYREEISGEEAVEKLWEDYGVEATIAEIPYYSENSGPSWEEGWNSFDMIIEMEGMDIMETEYLSGKFEELGTLEEPERSDISTSTYNTNQAIEFRDTETFSNHSGSYSASQETLKAWRDRYEDEVMQLDSLERGIYAAYEENESFRGAPLEPGEIDFISDKAVEAIN